MRGHARVANKQTRLNAWWELSDLQLSFFIALFSFQFTCVRNFSVRKVSVRKVSVRKVSARNFSMLETFPSVNLCNRARWMNFKITIFAGKALSEWWYDFPNIYLINNYYSFFYNCRAYIEDFSCTHHDQPILCNVCDYLRRKVELNKQ